MMKLCRILSSNDSFSDLQVVRYSVYGHYNAHYDTSHSSAGKEECCLRKGDIDCHLCRFVSTVKFVERWNDIIVKLTVRAKEQNKQKDISPCEIDEPAQC